MAETITPRNVGQDDETSAAEPVAHVVRRAPGARELDWQKHVARTRARNLILAVSVPVVLMVLWEIGARTDVIDTRFYASPSLVWDRLVSAVQDGTLQEHTIVTVRRLLLGYTLGSAAGIVVGLGLSQSAVLRAAFEPTLRGLYVIPKLALLPVLLLLFGLGETPKIAFITLGVFFIVAFSTLSAAMMIPTGYHEVADSYGFSRFQLFRWVVLPGSLPQIVAALRLASGIAVLLVVAVEFVQSNDGLGYLTWHSWELFLADRMYMGIMCISVLGVMFSGLVSLIGRWLVPWADEGVGRRN